ncbi:response regulator [Bremerella sp. JC770]|uniref:response regulator n=1 Tax=Bremerella sp. JC770 TaxID=3232137 RepID=UPI0034590FC3
MCKVTYFVQSCPTCGRKLQVKVEYLGLEVSCQHCGASFTSQDPAMVGAPLENPVDDALHKADAFLGRGLTSTHFPAAFGPN